MNIRKTLAIFLAVASATLIVLPNTYGQARVRLTRVDDEPDDLYAHVGNHGDPMVSGSWESHLDGTSESDSRGEDESSGGNIIAHVGNGAIASEGGTAECQALATAMCLTPLETATAVPSASSTVNGSCIAFVPNVDDEEICYYANANMSATAKSITDWQPDANAIEEDSQQEMYFWVGGIAGRDHEGQNKSLEARVRIDFYELTAEWNRQGIPDPHYEVKFTDGFQTVISLMPATATSFNHLFRVVRPVWGAEAIQMETHACFSVSAYVDNEFGGDKTRQEYAAVTATGWYFID